METNASVSKQARLRGGMAWILSFLLCLFLTVLSLLSLLECTLLSPGFLKKQVDKSAYTAHVIEDMEDIFVSYGISSDFDEAFFTSVLTEEEVRADIYAEIDRLYAADTAGADYDAYAEIYYTLSDTVRADFKAQSAYWDQFRDSVPQKASNTVYDSFLKSNDQELGMQSYGACVNLLVHYYIDEAREALG